MNIEKLRELEGHEEEGEKLKYRYKLYLKFEGTSGRMIKSNTLAVSLWHEYAPKAR